MTSTQYSAPSDTEPLRLSRSMTADDPNHRHLLLDHHTPPSKPSSTRRRVNPDALSIRLGRELVAELESFLQPGVVEMPSFAVRQDIQTRHKVDRRHIYDWFHSKGLRVTKEDKRATFGLKTDAMRMTRVRTIQSASARSRLHKNGASTQRSLLARCEPSVPGVVVPPASPIPVITPDYVVSLPWYAESQIRPIARVNWTVEAAPHLIPGASRTLRDPYIDNIYPLHENITLDYNARKSYYDTLSRIIGPADGIQECVGTYDAYMTKQLEIYYDRILPSGPLAASGVPGSPSTPVGSIPSLTVESAGVTTYTTDTLNLVSLDSADVVDTLIAGGNNSEANDTTALCDTSLALHDIIVSPVLDCVPPQPPRAKTVSFVPDDRALLNFSSLFVSPAKGSFYNQSSSSLAGALGECPPSITSRADQNSGRKKEWNRPQMGRARAYSGGGGI